MKNCQPKKTKSPSKSNAKVRRLPNQNKQSGRKEKLKEYLSKILRNIWEKRTNLMKKELQGSNTAKMKRKRPLS